MPRRLGGRSSTSYAPLRLRHDNDSAYLRDSGTANESAISHSIEWAHDRTEWIFFTAIEFSATNSYHLIVAHYRPHYAPLPSQDDPQSGRLILKDGTTATVRVAVPADRSALKQCFTALSQQDPGGRFLSFELSDDALAGDLSRTDDARRRLTLIVTHMSGNVSRVIAVGAFKETRDFTAQLSVSVREEYLGKGIGTLLLERLALAAVMQGIRHFRTVTAAQNQAVIDVFRNSGFDINTHKEKNSIEIDLSLLPTASSVERSELRDRVATAASIRPFFQPRGVAVVGASRNPNNIGTRILKAIIDNGFQAPVFPVNPRAEEIADLKTYATVDAIPEPVDLAVITVPAEHVLAVVDDCALKRVRALLIITAGFAEVGSAGKSRQAQLLDKVRGYGMRMVGPNCLGLLNTDPSVQLNASFAPNVPPHGPVAFCSQSGALGLAIIALARERQLGLSSFVSVGNKADISGNDLLQYWEMDGGTGTILLYLESFGNPRRFARIARRISKQKPIVAVKSGRTQAGQRAASSHTAALAATDLVVDALFHQTGVIRAETIDELFDLASALSTQPLPPGRRVAILTNAGGLGIMCADSCEAYGLQVQELDESIKDNLRQFLPATASVMNPVDMIASAKPGDFRKAAEILLAAEAVDALIVLTIHIGLADLSEIATAVRDGVQAMRAQGVTTKPVLTAIMDGSNIDSSLASTSERIPNYPFPENAARVLGKLATYAEWRNQATGVVPEFDDLKVDKARAVCRPASKSESNGWLSVDDIREILTAFALPLPKGGVCHSAEDAAALARSIGFPVAMKLASRTIVHKTEVGGVQLNLRDENEVMRAFRELQNRLAQQQRLAAMDGALLQPMIAGGVELMVGVTQDPSFGPLIGFGLGGIHVEILKDVCFRVTPITDRDASEMVHSIKGYRLLQGYRGHPPADIPAIEDLLLRIARLVEEVPEIAELDLNPVIALPPGQGCLIVDARIRVNTQH